MRRLIVRTVLLVVLILVVVKFFPAKTTKAAPQEIFGVCVSQVPREWGQFKGGSEQTGIAFEDAHGTLRFIANFPCNGGTPLVALEIRRTPGN
jgi:hypothetical protein